MEANNKLYICKRKIENKKDERLHRQDKQQEEGYFYNSRACFGNSCSSDNEICKKTVRGIHAMFLSEEELDEEIRESMKSGNATQHEVDAVFCR